MYHDTLAFQCIYERSDDGDENRDGKEGSEISRDYPTSCLHFFVVNRKRTRGRCWDGLLRCVKEEV